MNLKIFHLTLDVKIREIPLAEREEELLSRPKFHLLGPPWKESQELASSPMLDLNWKSPFLYGIIF